MMNDKRGRSDMPAAVAAIVERGFAAWADSDGDEALRARFDSERMPVLGVRHVRVWGLQVDDERELPGLERTHIPDDDIWEINLEGKDGSKYEVDSRLLRPADTG